ncbi:hypothetical protein M5K25_020173 [Dendrobium thyrsiflorum]|uniref:Uncharacterized protein n=1 Tax=Dendrobium thyrsiflorum TaxID=117978 RepID=A0ABD0U965_DENTH
MSSIEASTIPETLNKDQLPQGHWRIIGHPSTSPDLAPNPAASTRGIFLPTVALLGMAYLILRLTLLH